MQMFLLSQVSEGSRFLSLSLSFSHTQLFGFSDAEFLLSLLLSAVVSLPVNTHMSSLPQTHKLSH